MNNYYLEETIMRYRMNDLLAQAQREALKQQLKQVGKRRTKTRNRPTGSKMLDNWFSGPRNRSAAGMH